jgi:hypothetical protein
MRLHAEKGNLVRVQSLKDDDPAVSGTGKPTLEMPYGVTSFQIIGLEVGASVTVSLEFPDNVPTNATYYKIDQSGNWAEIPFGSNDGDKVITITLTDGDPLTDADGKADGNIDDPSALAYDAASATYAASGDDDDTCFIMSILGR